MENVELSGLGRPGYEFLSEETLVTRLKEMVSERILGMYRDREEARVLVRDEVEKFLSLQSLLLSREQISRISEGILDQLFGLGKIEPLLKDPEVSDIYVDDVLITYVRGVEQRTYFDNFADVSEVKLLVERLCYACGKSVSLKDPITEFNVRGARVCIVIPPASDAYHIAFRKFTRPDIDLNDQVKSGFLKSETASYFKDVVASRKNVLISGPTGSGKTTFLNALLKEVGDKDRVVCIEDVPEISLVRRDSARLVCRHSLASGMEEIGFRKLIKTALRLNPDRIILGEVRGEEALDLLRALNTGHSGSFCTIHANSAQDALYCLETLVMMGESGLGLAAVRRLIARTIQVIVHLRKEVTRASGLVTRRVGEVMEVKNTLDEQGRYVTEHVLDEG